MITPDDKEDLRHMALEFLAVRSTGAFNLRQIRRGVEREAAFKFTDEELVGALQLLLGLKLVSQTPDTLGSTLYWQATSEGVLHYERGAK